MKQVITVSKIRLLICGIVIARAAKSPEENFLKKPTGSFKSLFMTAASKSLSARVSILIPAMNLANEAAMEAKLQKKTKTQI